jgi:AcrR family transcriptional regulator
MSTWQHEGVARVTRAESKERTRQRLLAEAQRLFRERGYAATSLEQIAEAAEVTKGAIYGHFSSKEDLMLSAMEAAPAIDYSTMLTDESRPLRERLAEFGRAVSAEDDPGDEAELAVILEFWAALLRAPDALKRYSARVEVRLQELADAGTDQPPAGTEEVQGWAIGQALLAGLQIYKRLAPGIVTPEVFERAFGLLAGLYQEEPSLGPEEPSLCQEEPGLSPEEPGLSQEQ